LGNAPPPIEDIVSDRPLAEWQAEERLPEEIAGMTCVQPCYISNPPDIRVPQARDAIEQLLSPPESIGRLERSLQRHVRVFLTNYGTMSIQQIRLQRQRIQAGFEQLRLASYRAQEFCIWRTAAWTGMRALDVAACLEQPFLVRCEIEERNGSSYAQVFIGLATGESGIHSAICSLVEGELGAFIEHINLIVRTSSGIVCETSIPWPLSDTTCEVLIGPAGTWSIVDVVCAASGRTLVSARFCTE
jgi:hypothetical protein